MRYAILVTGPAGSGKSTFCSSIIAHAQSLNRNIHLFNLDPAATEFEYPPTIDIKDLISLQDVMEEMEYGPNGGLMYCFEYLLDNLDWLEEQLGSYEDDYLIIDCPGQIELYTHIPLLPRLVAHLQQKCDFRVCASYLLESQFMEDKSKFFAGTMSALSCMVSLEVSQVNLLSKMDLVRGRKAKSEVGRYLDPDPLLLQDDANGTTNPKFSALNQAIVSLIEDHNLVSFLPLDTSNPDSVNTILSHLDNAMQYGEDEEPKMPKDMDEGDFAEDDLQYAWSNQREAALWQALAEQE